MPIYAYKCASCGFAKDALQKLSDPPLTVCPSCGKPDFAKQVTAAGFQLKGSGWYVTDFRDGNKGGASKPASASEGTSSESSAGAAEAPAPAPAAAATPVASPAPAPSTSGGGSTSSGSSGSSTS